MPLREEIGLILHNVQANGQGALTLKDPMPIDPQVTSSIPRRSSTAPPKKPQTPYKKSKKRAREEEINGSDEDTLVRTKKVDLGTAILSLSKEMERARKARETYQSN